MQVSYRWLQQYVDIDWTPEELAERLTMAGVEVDQIRYRAAGISNVLTGRIVELKPHPNADRLQVCLIDVGRAEPVTIVTAATNVFAGAVVPVALEGAQLPTGQTITLTDFRGVPSQGMLCSGDELGLEKKLVPPEMRDGIYILPPEVAPGQDIRQVMQLDDYVLELDLTPNRSDCLSMLGVAYEVAALNCQPLRLPARHELNYTATSELVTVSVSAPDLCPGFYGLIIEDVQVGPSPLWLQSALQAAGVRPINTLVDVTNYVMLELGQPLHAYDLDQLAGQQISARRATDGEQLTTLDGVERELDSEVLVIADAQRAIGIAGVMGGLETEVTPDTKRVLLEAAYFEQRGIRRTSRRLGLRSDASSRFDKGVDPARVKLALERAAALIEQLGCGRVLPTAVGTMQDLPLQQVISLRPQRVNQLLGTDLSADRILELLRRLQLEVDTTQEPWTVVAPSRRRDLQDEIDLVEEVARLAGLDQIPTTMMQGPTMRGGLTPRQQAVAALRQQLFAGGVDEVVTLSFINPQEVAAVVGESHPWRHSLEVANPLSVERSFMRTSLFFGLANVLAYNAARNQSDLAVFELARVFVSDQAATKLVQPAEPLRLGIMLSGEQQQGWQHGSRPYDFYYLKGLLETVLSPLAGDNLVWEATQEPFLHPGRAARILWQGQYLGLIGELHPDVLDYYDLRQRAVFAEVDLEVVLAAAGETPVFRGIPRFPAVQRDLAVIVPEEVTAAAVAQTIRAAAGPLLQELRLFDVYQGEQVAAGEKSLAYALLFQSDERTLQEAEVSEITRQIVRALEDNLSASLR